MEDTSSGLASRFPRLIAESVGVLGVIASLVFVGIQIQQSAEATRAATVLSLKQSWADLNLMNASSMELSEAWEAVLNDGYEETDPRLRRLVAAHTRAIIHNWANAYYQYRIGTLDEEQWQPHLRDAEVFAEHPLLWKVWDEWGHIYDDPLRTLVDSLRVAKFK